MGRPLITAETLRTKIDCYFSLLEREEISAKARRAGLPISTFVRQSALGNKVSAPPSSGSVQKWVSLARTIGHFSQIAKHLNEGGRVDHDQLSSLLAEVKEQVQALRLDLLGNHHDTESR